MHFPHTPPNHGMQTDADVPPAPLMHVVGQPLVQADKESRESMNKGEIVKFSDLQIGDYFADSTGQKYRKIPEFDWKSPDDSPIVINAFHIQADSIVSLNPNGEFVFIANSAWSPAEQKKQNTLPDEIVELEYQLEFFAGYFAFMRDSLESLDASGDSLEGPLGYHDTEEFNDLMHSSFFVGLFSYLEAQLNDECRRSQQMGNHIKVLLDDIHGMGINRAKTYLVKVLKTSFIFENDPNWEKIMWFSKIRNCIVHNEGQVKDVNLKRYIIAHPNLRLETLFGADYVILDNDFCEHAIEVIGTFLKSLLYHRRADRIE